LVIGCLGWYTNQIYGAAAVGAGGFVIAGKTHSTGRGRSDLWLVRLDAEGDLLWERTLGGDRNDRARVIAPQIDGGVVAAGGDQSRGV
jgi:hypothetical protein